MLSYDPTRTSLYFPETVETVFRDNMSPEPLALAVEFCRLAYYRTVEKPADLVRLTAALASVGYGEVQLFSDSQSGAFGFGATRASDKTAVLAFRGMQPDDLSDFGTVLSVAPVSWDMGAGCIHSGFSNSYLKLHGEVSEWFAKHAATFQTTFCGHSLGGAIASVAAVVNRPTRLVTIGCPKVGDETFGIALSATPSVRVVNCCDIVPTLPPGNLFGYQHAIEATYIASNASITFPSDPNQIEADQIQARGHYFLNESWKPGAVLFRDLSDHSPANYVRVFY